MVSKHIRYSRLFAFSFIVDMTYDIFGFQRTQSPADGECRMRRDEEKHEKNQAVL